MDILQTIKIAMRGILDNKLRSFLTMLGIIIGVTSVIALVSIGQGATSQVTEQIQSLGSNLLTVNITGRGANTTISYEEAMELGESPYISAVAPIMNGSATVKHGNKNTTAQIQGTNEEFLSIRNYKLAEGRFITSADVYMRQKIAILGPGIAEDIFGLVSPTGQEIKINGQIFKVVGILESSSSMMGSNDEDIYIPVTTAERLLQNRGVRTIYMQAASEDTVDFATQEISAKLSRTFKTDADSDLQAYRIFSQTEMLDTLNETTAILTMMLGGIAAISLLVGGIGIMNIMLVSVTERTREIGIRKALGARKRDILSQFLIESLVLSGIGGVIGIIVGILMSRGMAQIMGITAKTTYSVTLVAFGFSMMVGIFFGLYPANKASSLKPIEALRYE